MPDTTSSVTELRAQLVSVKSSEAAHLLAAHHYLRRAPAGCHTCFGWEENGVLVAAALYGALHMPKGPAGWLELRRLVRSDALKAPLSRFLAASLRELDAPAVVAWSDPDAGHHGGIYQATGWLHVSPRSYSWNSSYRTPEGALLSHRVVFDMLGTTAKSKVAELRPDWVPELPAPKYRYVKPLTISSEAAVAALNGILRPYPKPTLNGAAARPPHAWRAQK